VFKEALKSNELTGVDLTSTYKMTHESIEIGSEASFSLVELEDLKPFKTVNGFLTKLMSINPVNSVYLKGKKVVSNNKNLLGINEDKLRVAVEKIKDKLL
jgi:hypothetical protein